MEIIDKLAWIEIEGKSILTTRSFGKKPFYIPGGKREFGESDHEALCREIKEELSVELLPETIKFVGVFEAQADGKPSGTYVKMTCYSAKYMGQIKESSEIEEIKWLNTSDKPIIAEVDKIIFDYLYENGLLN